MDLVESLGWRESALCQLWASDVDRGRSSEAPHGRLRKRWQTDKEGRKMWVPLSAEARAALDRVLELQPAIGDAPLFPEPRVKGRSWSRWYARDLLQRTEKRAGLEKVAGGQFHPYRRKWASERKHLPLADVAAAGGWRPPRPWSVVTCSRTQRRCWLW